MSFRPLIGEPVTDTTDLDPVSPNDLDFDIDHLERVAHHHPLSDAGKDHLSALRELRELRRENRQLHARHRDLANASFEAGGRTYHVGELVTLRRTLGGDREEWSNAELAMVALWDIVEADLDLEP